MLTFWLALAACASGLVYASLFEWTLHRYVMHRPFLKFSYPYRTHGITHHETFGPAKTYHLIHEEHRNLITMAWWNGPVLLAINTPPAFLGLWLSGSWVVFGAFMGTLLCYYVAYEYFHYCMHLPKPRWFQNVGLFKWVDRHHRLHHLMPDRNLNVVLPLADVLSRTRISRAPV